MREPEALLLGRRHQPGVQASGCRPAPSGRLLHMVASAVGRGVPALTSYSPASYTPSQVSSVFQPQEPSTAQAVTARTSTPSSLSAFAVSHASATHRSCSSRVQPLWTSVTAIGVA